MILVKNDTENKRKTNRFNDTVNNLPAVNIYEQENAWKLEVAAPGMKRDDFSLQYDKGQLKISAEKNENTESSVYRHKEFGLDSFDKRFRVSEELIDAEKIDAEYDNGILTVNLPKNDEEDRMKSININ